MIRMSGLHNKQTIAPAGPQTKETRRAPRKSSHVPPFLLLSSSFPPPLIPAERIHRPKYIHIRDEQSSQISSILNRSSFKLSCRWGRGRRRRREGNKRSATPDLATLHHGKGKYSNQRWSRRFHLWVSFKILPGSAALARKDQFGSDPITVISKDLARNPSNASFKESPLPQIEGCSRNRLQNPQLSRQGSSNRSFTGIHQRISQGIPQRNPSKIHKFNRFWKRSFPGVSEIDPRIPAVPPGDRGERKRGDRGGAQRRPAPTKPANTANTKPPFKHTNNSNGIQAKKYTKREERERERERRRRRRRRWRRWRRRRRKWPETERINQFFNKYQKRKEEEGKKKGQRIMISDNLLLLHFRVD